MWETKEKRQQRIERIRRRKAQGLPNRYLYDYTFTFITAFEDVLDFSVSFQQGQIKIFHMPPERNQLFGITCGKDRDRRFLLFYKTTVFSTVLEGE